MPQSEIRLISAAQTYPLRGAVLRPGQPPSESVFPGDDDSQTLHLGAFVDERLLGIATIFPERAPFAPDMPAYRLRGMAVALEAQRTGLGRAIIIECLKQAGRRSALMVWCNARVAALEFYRALGFETCGAQFEVPGIGPHFVMHRSCDSFAVPIPDSSLA